MSILNPQELLVAAGAVLSILFLVVPPLRKRYNPLDGSAKASIMAILILIVAVAVVIFSCTGLVDTVTCSKDGVFTYLLKTVGAALLSLTGNQATYVLAAPIAQKLFESHDAKWKAERAVVASGNKTDQ